MQRTDSFEKTLMWGKIEGRRRRGWQGHDSWMVLSTPWTWVWESFGSWWRTGKSGVLQSIGLQRIGHDWVTEQQQQQMLHVMRWLIRKESDAGRDWRQEKGMTEDEMAGWHHWLDGHEFEKALGVGDGQRNLACCSPWGYKESDTTKQLNWTEIFCFY